MPGLIGFSTHNLTQERAAQTIEKMQSTLFYEDTFSRDPIFQDASICSSRVHLGVFNPEAQPADCGDVKVWLDGEFCNRLALQKTLKAASNRHESADQFADPEILAALYQQQDDFSFLKNIDGIFSAIIYDGSRQQVHIVSDRYGLRPLYWTIHQESLAWSSELKGFLELPDFRPEIDPLAVEDFFGLRYLMGDRSWFVGVELVPAATVLTWQLTEKTLHPQRYWWWDEVKLLPPSLSEDDLAGKLGNLFIKAVENRSLQGEHTGLTLSGGLDSRAIIAAMPHHQGASIEAITYGRKGCEDIRIARRVAKVKQANFTVVDINSENWLKSRVDKVWQTDGSCSLIHMQFTSALEKIKEENIFDCLLHGAGGDGFVGGDHLFDHEQLDYYILKRLNLINFADSAAHKESVLQRFKDYYEKIGACPHTLYIDSRIRSFLLKDIKVSATYGIECRLPFLDNDFQEFLYAIPNQLKLNNYLYAKMLVKTFPDFFQKIPRQGTGEPISPPNFTRRMKKSGQKLLYRIHNKVKRVVRSWGLSFPDWEPTQRSGDFYDYNTWLRQEPARSLVEKMLNNSAALYPKYISHEKVRQHWQSHLAGETNNFDKLGQILTFEIWLQQVFNGQYRSDMGSSYRE